MRPSSTDELHGPRTRRRRRVFRVALIVFVVLLAGLAAAIGFLPEILSTDAGRAFLERRLEERLATEVALGPYDLSWSGPQTLERIEVGSSTRAGFRAERELLAMEDVVVDLGLWGLIVTSKPIVLQVEEARAHVVRSGEGRFNFEGLVEEAPRAPERPGEREPGPVERVTEAARGFRLEVASGTLLYEDALLETRADLERYEWLVDLRRRRIALKLEPAEREREGGPPEEGWIFVDAAAEFPEGAKDIEEAAIDARVRLDEVDLQPYRGLLERYLGWIPPEDPVQGRIEAETREGIVTAEADLDFGYLAVPRASAVLPLESGRRRAELDLAYRAELESAAASLPGFALPPAGGRIRGDLSGTVRARGDLSLAAIYEEGMEALRRLSADIAFDARGLDIAWPRAAAEAGVAPEPWELREPRLEGALSLEAGEAGSVRVTRGRIEGEGIRFTATGGARPLPGEEGGWSFELRSDLEAGSRWIGLFAPAAVQVEPQAELRTRGLTLEGSMVEGRPLLAGIQARGQVELTGGVSAAGLDMDRLESGFALGESRLRFSDARAGVNGGTARAETLALDLSGDEPRFEAAFALEGVEATYDVSPILAYIFPFLSLDEREGAIQGAIEGTLALRGAGFDYESIRRTLRGEGEIRVRNGLFSGSRFFRELAAILVTDFDRVLFREMGSRFRAADGIVRVDRVYLEPGEGAKVRNLGLEGLTRFDGTLDYGVNLTALRETIGDDKIRRILEVARQVLGESGLPLRLRGTLESPQLTLAPLPGIDVERGVERGAEEALERALEDVFDDLFKKRDR